MSDPLAALHAPITPVDPDPDFAARLRRRIERALALPRGVAVTTTTLRGVKFDAMKTSRSDMKVNADLEGVAKSFRADGVTVEERTVQIAAHPGFEITVSSTLLTSPEGARRAAFSRRWMTLSSAWRSHVRNARTGEASSVWSMLSFT